MIQLQLISKVLATQDYSLIDNYLLTEEYFVGYENEYNFLKEHFNKYGNVPDKATFLSKFPDIDLVEVTESDQYLIDTVREEFLYQKSVPVIQHAADLLKADSNAAAEYLLNAIKTLQPNYDLGGSDIIATADQRYERYMDRKVHQDSYFFTSGFEELDDLIHGIQREEELFVIFARTNQGKSWILEKMCTHVWQLGFNVGYVSPEMSAISVGYRFDTLYKNYSNKGLMWGTDTVDDRSYKIYTDDLKQHSNKFVVATPLEFDRKITVSKLRNWVKQFKLDMLAVDGITYLTDERFKRGDTKTTTLTNISEDLMELSIELKIPILVVVQANRSGAIDKEESGTPELESIRDSDGIAHNASKVLSIRQKDHILEMGIKKQRFGKVGGKLNYNWDIDVGQFEFVPSYDDAESEATTQAKVTEARSKFSGDKEDVF